MNELSLLNLIRCVRCLEHLLYSESRVNSDYSKMYNKLVDILIEKTNKPMTELYGQIKAIQSNKETNALEAIAFFNRFIEDNRTRMDVKERKIYQNIMHPLISGMWLDTNLSYSEIYSLGDKLIKKYF
jgi:hypothetical protein